jgi:hypothetical protein
MSRIYETLQKAAGMELALASPVAIMRTAVAPPRADERPLVGIEGELSAEEPCKAIKAIGLRWGLQ